ncbi:MAG: GIY-YIG nuclease family protein [Candidatus Omnitrophica bacterium]|nr:GIY-YIG nuclease family protein [Candidatus Omnitrophota bacterium]
MHYVYILRSINHPKRLYIGCTRDIEKRLVEHSRGDGTYSKTYASWELEAYTAFQDQQVAERFERYLKSGSGHAFLKKRLLPKLPSILHPAQPEQHTVPLRHGALVF